ncbi:MAG: TMEM14 family protein [Blastocatellales bacterium]
MAAWLVLIYGILVAAGGVMGYIKASSMASLISGGVAGLALAGSAVAMMKGAYSTGWWISLIIALLLLGRFGSVVLSSGFKLMPGGMVIILSVIVIAVLLTHRA